MSEWKKKKKTVENYAQLLRSNVLLHPMHDMCGKQIQSERSCVYRPPLMPRRILDLSQIIHSVLDTLFSAVAEFPHPGLIDMKHTCLNASGGTLITWDHVFLSRVSRAAPLSGLFCVLQFCWGSARSLYPQPRRSDKNDSSSGVHVNQSGEI